MPYFLEGELGKVVNDNGKAHEQDR
jgi:hypothetical protein